MTIDPSLPINYDTNRGGVLASGGMSIGGFDIVARIKNLLNFGKKDNSLKRRAEDQPEYTTLTKYQKFDTQFPKIITQPFEDDILFLRPRVSAANVPPVKQQKKPMDSGTKFAFLRPRTTTKHMVNNAYADLEFSDDEDDIMPMYRGKPATTSSSSRNVANPSTSRMRYTTANNDVFRPSNPTINIPIRMIDRKPPPLIEAKTGGILASSVIPSLQPIRKTGLLNSSEYTNGFSSSDQVRPSSVKKYENERMSYLNGQKSGNIIRNSFINSNPTSIVAQAYNLKQKESYYDLLTKLAPTLYSQKGKQRLSTSREVISDREDSNPVNANKNIRRRSKPIPVINLTDDDEEDQRKEVIDLDADADDVQVISACEKLNSYKRFEEKKELPPVAPVNSFKERIDLTPVCRTEWLENFKLRWDERSRQQNKKISEAEEEVRQSSKETERNEKIIQDKLKNFVIDAETVILDESEEEEEDEFPEINEEDKNRVRKAVFHGPSDEVLVSKFNMNITRRDINTLVGDSWLNDEVINFYMNLLVERSKERCAAGLPQVYAMNTFFLPRLLQSGHSGVRRWTRKVDIFSYDIIPVPVHVGGMHWCMAIIHLKNKTIKYYDSLGTPNPKVLIQLEQYLKDESMDKKNERFDTSNFQKESVADVPRQLNGSDCGVFSCMFAEYISRNKQITFSQEHMPYFRQKMILEIICGKLLL